MVKLSIIILSFNTKEITLRCLDSLFLVLSSAENRGLSYEVIVVENASSDGSVEMLKKIKNSKLKIQNFNAKFKVILNTKNIGYTKGNNRGLKEATGEYVLFLNSDTVIEDLNFQSLITYLENHTNVGVMTVRVLLPDRRIDPASHRGFPTVWNSFCYFLKLERMFGKTPILNRIFGGYHLTYHKPDIAHEIDSPTGAFYLTRKHILDKLNGFDEDFFMYGEDLDLSFRIKKLGYKIVYYPRFTITHLKHVSGMKHKDAKRKNKTKDFFYAAMKIFYRKHYALQYPDLLNDIVYFIIDLKKRFT